MTTKLIAIVPAYNESARVGDTVRALAALRPELEKDELDLSVYVINDGSTDDTGKVAATAGADRVIAHRTNQGLGAAVRSGLVAAREDGADIAVKFDADLQHDPEDIPALIAPILSDEADVVYGNRFPRIEYRMPFVRRVGNLSFTWLMRRLTGWPLKDSQPGIFALDRSYLQVFNLPGDYNYTQQILLDAYHKGMRFAHVPVCFRKRITGKSFVSFKYPVKVIGQILMVLVGVKPLRIFVPLGLTFLAVGAGMFAFEFAQWLSGSSPKPVRHVNAILGFGMFGLQTLFFGLLAQLIVDLGKRS